MTRKTLPPIAQGVQRSWTLIADGQAVDCRSAELTSRYGTWSYGQHPHGYDSWWFAERGGGGAVTLPYTRIGGQVWVGLIEENRPNMGGPVLCAIGGYLDLGETHGEAARREAHEEVGLAAEQAELPGPPLCSNRAFFVADPSLGEGVRCFAVEVSSARLAARDSNRQLPAAPDAEVPEILFMPWQIAVLRCADALAVAAIARLVARETENVQAADGPG